MHIQSLLFTIPSVLVGSVLIIADATVAQSFSQTASEVGFPPSPIATPAPSIETPQCGPVFPWGPPGPAVVLAECEKAIKKLAAEPQPNVPIPFTRNQHKEPGALWHLSTWSSSRCHLSIRSIKYHTIEEFRVTDLVDQATMLLKTCVGERSPPTGGWINIGDQSRGFYIALGGIVPHLQTNASAETADEISSDSSDTPHGSSAVSVTQRDLSVSDMKRALSNGFAFNNSVAQSLGTPRVHCYQPEEQFKDVKEFDCTWVIRNEISISGPQFKELRWGHGPGVDRDVPVSWDHNSCHIFVNTPNAQEIDLFNLFTVGVTARRIINQCITTNPDSPLGGTSSVGNGDFFVGVHSSSRYGGNDVLSVSNIAPTLETGKPADQMSQDVVARDVERASGVEVAGNSHLSRRYYDTTTANSTDASLPKDPVSVCIGDGNHTITGLPLVDPSDCLHILESWLYNGLASVDGTKHPPNASNTVPDEDYPDYNISIPQSFIHRTCYVTINTTLALPANSSASASGSSVVAGSSPQTSTAGAITGGQTSLPVIPPLTTQPHVTIISPIDVNAAINVGNRLFNTCVLATRPYSYGGVAILEQIKGYRGYDYPNAVGTVPGASGNVYLSFSASNATSGGSAAESELQAAVKALVELNSTSTTSSSTTPVNSSEPPNTATATPVYSVSSVPAADPTSTRGAGAQFGFWGP